jgi:hypothetical protein
LIQNSMIVSFHAYPNDFVRSRHSYLPQSKAIVHAQSAFSKISSNAPRSNKPPQARGEQECKRDSSVSQLQIKLFVFAGRRNSGVSASTNGFPRVYRGWGLKRSVCMLGDLEQKSRSRCFQPTPAISLAHGSRHICILISPSLFAAT